MKDNIDFINTWPKKFGLLYTIAITIIFAILNFYNSKIFPSSATMVISGILLLTLVTLLIPIILFIKHENWSATNFGIVFNKKMVFITLIFTIPLIIILLNRSATSKPPVHIISIIIRFGEELFYRGFLFHYFTIIFKKKKYSIIKTILLSSLLFALVHTQTFLPANPQTMFDIFLFAIVFAIIRYYTKSILTSVVIHCITDAGLVGGILGAVIYFILYKSKLNFNIQKDSNSTLAEN